MLGCYAMCFQLQSQRFLSWSPVLDMLGCPIALQNWYNRNVDHLLETTAVLVTHEYMKPLGFLDTQYVF